MKYLLSLFFIFCSVVLFADTYSYSQSYKFRVYLKDKGHTSYTIDNPLEFLTKESIERKQEHNIEIDESDFPISGDYFRIVEKAGGKVVSFSKWFKTLVVELQDSISIDTINSLSFVDSAKYVWRGNPNAYSHALRPRLDKFGIQEDEVSVSFYGRTKEQFELHNATYMFDAGYQGKGMKVGVIDAGFTNFDVIPHFESVKLDGYANFVPGGGIFSANDHGTKVLSTMAVYMPGIMIGSAPEAYYHLMRSEDIVTEFPVEEDYWVRAIEYADSIGIDVINTSLGYNSFDDSDLNYTHDDLTGRASIMSHAADVAYDKGMLIVVSAGNEGNKQWQNTTPPGDAYNVIAVGAVGTDSIIAPFSSNGEMADGRIKPDFVSVGSRTVTINKHGVIGTTNGTSLSSPYLAGLITSLWSVNPGLHRSDLKNILWESADRHSEPHPVYGNGIIDFRQAYIKVLQSLKTYNRIVDEDGVVIKPVSRGMYVIDLQQALYSNNNLSVRLLDEEGILVTEQKLGSEKTASVAIDKDLLDANDYIHFVIDTPIINKTYRIKM